jgi:hypothetical protein
MKMVKNVFLAKKLSQAIILLGLSGSGQCGGEIKTSCYWHSLCRWSINQFTHGDVAMESQNSLPCKPAD